MLALFHINTPLIRSDEEPTLEMLDFAFHIGSTPTFLYFDLYLNTAYAAHGVYFVYILAGIFKDQTNSVKYLFPFASLSPLKFEAPHFFPLCNMHILRTKNLPWHDIVSLKLRNNLYKLHMFPRCNAYNKWKFNKIRPWCRLEIRSAYIYIYIYILVQLHANEVPTRILLLPLRFI